MWSVSACTTEAEVRTAGALIFRVCFIGLTLLVLCWGLNLAAGPTQNHTHPTGTMQVEIWDVCWREGNQTQDSRLCSPLHSTTLHTNSKPHRVHKQEKTPPERLGLPLVFTSWGNSTCQLETPPAWNGCCSSLICSLHNKACYSLLFLL